MSRGTEFLDFIIEKLNNRLCELEQTILEEQKDIESMNDYYWENYTEMDQYGYENFDNQQALLGRINASNETRKSLNRIRKMMDSPELWTDFKLRIQGIVDEITSYEDEQAFIERYRCQCGEFKGRLFEHEICPICGTPVEYKDSNINVTGWISLGDNRIISPYYYNVFLSALGKTIFPDIINGRHRINTDGNKERPSEEDMEVPPSSPYAGIGVDSVYENYENILT